MFKFSLQRVLDLRARKEQEIATRHAQARSAADAARDSASALEATREAGRLRVSEEAQGPLQSAGLLQQMSFVLSQLDVHVAAAQQHAANAEFGAQRVLGELTAAFKDRRVLDRLKERQHEGFRVAETQLDRSTMDDIALARFNQGGATGEGKTPTSSPANGRGGDT